MTKKKKEPIFISKLNDPNTAVIYSLEDLYKRSDPNTITNLGKVSNALDKLKNNPTYKNFYMFAKKDLLDTLNYSDIQYRKNLYRLSQSKCIMCKKLHTKFLVFLPNIRLSNGRNRFYSIEEETNYISMCLEEIIGKQCSCCNDSMYRYGIAKTCSEACSNIYILKGVHE